MFFLYHIVTDVELTKLKLLHYLFIFLSLIMYTKVVRHFCINRLPLLIINHFVMNCCSVKIISLRMSVIQIFTVFLSLFYTKKYDSLKLKIRNFYWKMHAICSSAFVVVVVNAIILEDLVLVCCIEI